MFEISRIIEKKGFISRIIYSIFDIFFSLVRKLYALRPYKNENIVVIALHKLGDSVFTIPAIKLITTKYPPEKISLVCFPDSKPIYELVFQGINFVTIEHSEILWDNRLVKSSARKRIKKLSPSVIFDITGLAPLIFDIRAREIIGMSKRQFKAIYDIHTSIRSLPHLMDTYLDVVRKKINSEDSVQLKIFPVLPGANCTKILIHPFAGWKAKEWNFNKFIKLAEKLSANNYEIAFIVKHGEIKGDNLKEVEAKRIKIIETTDIKELIEVIKDYSLIISNDSGPVYIASMLGKPTFTIYGPTNPEYSLPIGSGHAFIQKEISCSPGKNEQYCFTNAGRNGCPSFECMNLLEVNEVYSSVEKFINTIYSENKHELSGNYKI